MGTPVLATTSTTRGRPGLTATHIWRPGQDEQDLSPVEAMRDTSPVTYVMADAGGEPIKGTFYGPKLQKVTPPDYFDVESILDTRRWGNVTVYLVKWAGYPASFNSWERDVIRISGSPFRPRRRRPRAGRRRGGDSPS